VSKSLGLRFAPVGGSAELVDEGRGKIWFVVKHIHFQVGGSTPRNYGSRAEKTCRELRSGRVIDSGLLDASDRASNPTESHAGRIKPRAAGCDLTAHLVWIETMWCNLSHRRLTRRIDDIR
jgi:hypothetical protein